MIKLIVVLFLCLHPITSSADEIPDKNAEGMKKVQGTVVEVERVETSRRGSDASVTGNPLIDFGVNLIEAIYGTNYSGFPLYQVKVNEAITLEVASRESFGIGDCVLVWYDEAMGETPNLSMLGQGGIAKSNDCSK